MVISTANVPPVSSERLAPEKRGERSIAGALPAVNFQKKWRVGSG
jgi:hypothetical protein